LLLDVHSRVRTGTILPRIRSDPLSHLRSTFRAVAQN
jgi:hypothetical protein